MLTKRSFSLAGHRTSVALEPEFWTALAGIAARESAPLSVLVARVDSARAPETSLASALRVLALRQSGHEETTTAKSVAPTGNQGCD
jgi:predicted DNA-binding ribbon-helix-helix protein